MPFKKISHHSGFTLIELMVAMTIFAMMSIMVITIYLSTTATSRRLNAERQLSETAREIVENIRSDIGKYGFSGSAPAFDPTGSYIPWSKYAYTLSGSEYLNLSNTRYVYGQKNSTGIIPCIGDKKTNTHEHCGLYRISYDDNGINGENLVDSFIPLDGDKRVKLSDFRFYVSGDGTNNPYKVTLIATLVLTNRNHTPLISAYQMHIQTTLAQRGWKKY